MTNVVRCSFISLICVALTACGSPYNSLMTPQLISIVDEEQSFEQQNLNLCVDPTLSPHQSYLGVYRLKDWRQGVTLMAKAGGRVDLNDCFGFEGYTSIVPDVTLQAIETLSAITMSVDANQDTVLLVQTPSGEYLFDDDSGQGTNPTLTVSSEPGDYRLWIGTHDVEHAFETLATLVVSMDDSR